MDVDSLAHNVARRSNVPESSSEQSLTARSPDGAACAGEPCMEGSVGCFAFKLDGGMPHVPQNKSCEQQRVSQHAEKRALTLPGKEASGKDKEDERPSFTGNGIRPRAASFDAKTMEIDELDRATSTRTARPREGRSRSTLWRKQRQHIPSFRSTRWARTGAVRVIPPAVTPPPRSGSQVCLGRSPHKGAGGRFPVRTRARPPPTRPPSPPRRSRR